jgi:hypothetical protein
MFKTKFKAKTSKAALNKKYNKSTVDKPNNQSSRGRIADVEREGQHAASRKATYDTKDKF